MQSINGRAVSMKPPIAAASSMPPYHVIAIFHCRSNRNLPSAKNQHHAERLHRHRRRRLRAEHLHAILDEDGRNTV